MKEDVDNTKAEAYDRYRFLVGRGNRARARLTTLNGLLRDQNPNLVRLLEDNWPYFKSAFHQTTDLLFDAYSDSHQSLTRRRLNCLISGHERRAAQLSFEYGLKYTAVKL